MSANTTAPRTAPSHYADGEPRQEVKDLICHLQDNPLGLDSFVLHIYCLVLKWTNLLPDEYLGIGSDKELPWHRIRMADLAAATGASKESCGKAIKYLAQERLILRKETHTRDEDTGYFQTEVFVLTYMDPHTWWYKNHPDDDPGRAKHGPFLLQCPDKKCRHVAPDKDFEHLRRCPQCGKTFDARDVKPYRPVERKFLRVLPPPPPPTPEEQAELEAMEQARLEEARAALDLLSLPICPVDPPLPPALQQHIAAQMHGSAPQPPAPGESAACSREESRERSGEAPPPPAKPAPKGPAPVTPRLPRLLPPCPKCGARRWQVNHANVLACRGCGTVWPESAGGP